MTDTREVNQFKEYIRQKYNKHKYGRATYHTKGDDEMSDKEEFSEAELIVSGYIMEVHAMCVELKACIEEIGDFKPDLYLVCNTGTSERGLSCAFMQGQNEVYGILSTMELVKEITKKLTQVHKLQLLINLEKL